MPHVRRMLSVLAVAILIAGAAAAEPLFTLADDGRTFLYRARPGDHPSGVAEMFGISAKDLPAFLAANGITDATRVGAGFVYRIPNETARRLSDRAAALQTDNARLARAAREDRERVQGLARAAEEARGAAADAEARTARLARMETLWPWARGAMFALLLVAAAAAYTAVAAMRRRSQAERYARTLARELEEKRRAALSERQESARRVLDLETRLRALEAQLGPRVVISGRGGS
jgi:hypothetical protein